MTKTFLVTGGTGKLGALVVRLLRQAGDEVRVASRRTGDGLATVDWKTGAGLGDALSGVDVVVHCAYQARGADLERKLVAAAKQAGVRHLVYISIVGVDKIPFFFYQAKLEAEHVFEQSGVPYTILRATQFHDLIRVLLAGMAKSPVMFLPSLRFQPIDTSEVAGRLAELAMGPPAGRVADLAGPKTYSLRELARIYLKATGRRRPIVSFSLPGTAFRTYKAGFNLAPENATGKIDFEDYLAAHPDQKTVSYRGQR
jgi:uncharacterized protein YbjT (DUF2867 family)